MYFNNNNNINKERTVIIVNRKSIVLQFILQLNPATQDIN